MQNTVWKWFNDYAAQASIEGHPLKQRLVQIYFEADTMQRFLASPEQAVKLYREGAQLATQLNEPCWELFYEHQISDLNIFSEHDYEKGRDQAVRTATRAYKDAYLTCPVRASVYHALVYVYGAIDSLGYEDKMREMMAYMEREIPMDADIRSRLQYIRVLLAYDRRDFAACESEAQVYMSMTESDPTRQVYDLLMGMSYAKGELRQAIQYADHYEQWGMRFNISAVIAHARLNKAVFEQILGEPERAARHFAQGKVFYAPVGSERDPSFYDTVCRYHELIGEERYALQLREEQVADLPASLGIDQRFYPQLQYCRLLGRMGLDVTDALNVAESIANESVKPAIHLEKVNRIRNGEFFQFAWEKSQ